jgi:hypothetical protein
VEEYVANEGWSISTKRMILLDQPRLEKETIVRFEVSLANKEKVIRAEARVVGYQPPESGRPGGPKVRFKRFGGTTKAFIQRVVAEHGPAPGLDTVHPSSPADALASVHPPAVDSAPLGDAPSDREASSSLERTSSAGATASPDTEPPGAPHSPGAPTPGTAGSNGAGFVSAPSADALERLRQLVQTQGYPRIDAPPDRDSLLERLRERGRSAGAW